MTAALLEFNNSANELIVSTIAGTFSQLGEAIGNALITASLGIPDKIKALLVGANTVYLAVVVAKLGNKPTLVTAAFKNENSELSSSVAKVTL